MENKMKRYAVSYIETGVVYVDAKTKEEAHNLALERDIHNFLIVCDTNITDVTEEYEYSDEPF